MLATNAPKHWPGIDVELKPGYSPHNHVALAKALYEALPEGAFVNGVHSQFLWDDGILEIPASVKDGDQKFMVFVYGRADEEACRNFTWVHSFAKKLGARAVYYAPSRLKPAPPKPQWRDFNWDILDIVEDEDPKHRWSWWDDPKEPLWAGSMVQEAMRRAYTALNGFETYAYASMLFYLGLMDRSVPCMPLPDEHEEYLVQGPHKERFLVSASKKRGLRFHFDPYKTSPTYRDNLWRHYASYCEHFRSVLEEKRAAKDPTTSLPWFKTMDEYSMQEEQEEPVGGARVGGVLAAK